VTNEEKIAKAAEEHKAEINKFMWTHCWCHGLPDAECPNNKVD
jgi:hypothetical protein